MFKHIVKIATAITFGLALSGAAYSQSGNISEAYSTADGSVQFILLGFETPVPVLAGQTLIASDGNTEHTFTLTHNVADCHSFACEGVWVLVATQGFADLHLVEPDFVVPNGFLFLPSGSVRLGVIEALYDALPTDRWNARWGPEVRPAIAINSAGESYTFSLDQTNYTGLWWAAGGAESGWGISFAHAGDRVFSEDRVFATWYTYDTAGKPWWLSMLGARTIPKFSSTSSDYTGEIYVDSGPPLDNFIGKATATSVGRGSLTFSDANHGFFAYELDAGTGGSPVPVVQGKEIERFNLGIGPQSTCIFSPTANLELAANYQDLWWVANGMESGWGISLAHQGDTLFAAWYTYDTGGAPLWLSALMNHVSRTDSYAGPLNRTSGPRFDAFATAKVVSVPVGSASLTFANGNSATFNYITYGNEELPAMSQPQTKAIARFPFGPGGTVCK